MKEDPKRQQHLSLHCHKSILKCQSLKSHGTEIKKGFHLTRSRSDSAGVWYNTSFVSFHHHLTVVSFRSSASLCLKGHQVKQVWSMFNSCNWLVPRKGPTGTGGGPASLPAFKLWLITELFRASRMKERKRNKTKGCNTWNLLEICWFSAQRCRKVGSIVGTIFIHL